MKRDCQWPLWKGCCFHSNSIFRLVAETAIHFLHFRRIWREIKTRLIEGELSARAFVILFRVYLSLYLFFFRKKICSGLFPIHIILALCPYFFLLTPNLRSYSKNTYIELRIECSQRCARARAGGQNWDTFMKIQMLPNGITKIERKIYNDNTTESEREKCQTKTCSTKIKIESKREREFVYCWLDWCLLARPSFSNVGVQGKLLFVVVVVFIINTC